MQPDQLRGLREAAGMTQQQLATAIGMSRVTVGLMERGAEPILDRTVHAVRHATGPYQFLADWRLPAELAVKANALLDEINAACDEGEVSGIVRLGNGHLMLGMRARRD